MNPKSFDPGLTQQYGGTLRRSVNPDGSFNVHRIGTRLRDTNLFLALTSLSWPSFLLFIGIFYLGVNTLFAGAYLVLGVENLQGADARTPTDAFWTAFFFSAQTLTTVGYGHIAPKGLAVSILAALEAMVGVMGFALGTSLMYGRLSRPSARLVFSDRMLIVPYQGGWSTQFRVANRRANILMEIEARMSLMTVERVDGVLKRNFAQLDLERAAVQFMPLTWTVVHPIGESSPLFGKTAQDLKDLQAEFLIVIKAFDDTFSQVVHSRYSYRFDELEWNVRFTPAFHIDNTGDLILDIGKVHDIADLPRAEGS